MATDSAQPARLEGRPALYTIGPVVDDAARSLPLWSHDRTTALYYLLTDYESSIRASVEATLRSRDPQTIINSDNLRRSYEFGITPLLLFAYERCATSHPRLQRVPFREDVLSQAREAMRFGDRYHTVITTIEMAFDGRASVVLDGKDAIFQYREEDAIDYDAIGILASMHNQPSHPHIWSALGLAQLDDADAIATEIAATTKVSHDNLVSYNPTRNIRRAFRTLAEMAVAETILPENLSVSGYTVEQFRTFHRMLYEIAAMHQCYCWFGLGRETRGRDLPNLMMSIRRADLEEQAAGRSLLSPSVVPRIIDDLTYDPAIKRTDIFFQPLLPISDRDYMLCPIVVTSSKWERNLEKLWHMKYESEYNAVTSRVKAKLSAVIDERFTALGLTASHDSELRLDGSASVTDADVAVIVPDAKVLLLAEVKWLVEPADNKEVRRGDSTLAGGAEQARDALKFVREHSELAGNILFPRKNVAITSDYQIYTLVIGRNYAGSRSVQADDVPIIDCDLMMQYLEKQQPGVRLLDIIGSLRGMYSRLRLEVDFVRRTESFWLAGYRFRVEGFHFVA